MNLSSITNAPRAFVLGGVSYRARALTLGQLGEVLAWLEDRLPSDPARHGPLLFSDVSSRLALSTTEGLAVLLHLSLLSCHPSLSRDDARTLAATMDADDESRLLAIAFRRVPTARTTTGRPAKDLTEVNWGEVFESVTGHRAAAYADVAGLSLDQFDNFVNRGRAHDEGTLSPADVQAMWDAANPNPQETTGV